MLKRLRRKKHYTQKLLAKKLGISQSYLSKLESGDMEHRHNVTIELIENIAKEFKVCPVAVFIYFSKLDDKCKKYCHNCSIMQNNL